jgi:hypothetical protein
MFILISMNTTSGGSPTAVQGSPVTESRSVQAREARDRYPVIVELIERRVVWVDGTSPQDALRNIGEAEDYPGDWLDSDIEHHLPLPGDVAPWSGPLLGCPSCGVVIGADGGGVERHEAIAGRHSRTCPLAPGCPAYACATCRRSHRHSEAELLRLLQTREDSPA